MQFNFKKMGDDVTDFRQDTATRTPIIKFAESVMAAVMRIGNLGGLQAERHGHHHLTKANLNTVWKGARRGAPPSQGEREKARRRRQLEKGQI